MNPRLRRQVFRRAGGRCEYCLLPVEFDFAPHAVDHVVAFQHGGPTAFANLALACGRCNWHKGPNLSGVDPRTGRIVRLFNPRADSWSLHFRYQGPLLVGKTPRGRATIRTLAINSPRRLLLRGLLLEDGKFSTEAT